MTAASLLIGNINFDPTKRDDSNTPPPHLLIFNLSIILKKI